MLTVAVDTAEFAGNPALDMSATSASPRSLFVTAVVNSETRSACIWIKSSPTTGGSTKSNETLVSDERRVKYSSAQKFVTCFVAVMLATEATRDAATTACAATSPLKVSACTPPRTITLEATIGKVGATVGVTDGAMLGAHDGVLLGPGDVGAPLGALLGVLLGTALGAFDGAHDGVLLGPGDVGAPVGANVAPALVGSNVVGEPVGTAVGVTDGAMLGAPVGTRLVGVSVGAFVITVTVTPVI